MLKGADRMSGMSTMGGLRGFVQTHAVLLSFFVLLATTCTMLLTVIPGAQAVTIEVSPVGDRRDTLDEYLVTVTMPAAHLEAFRDARVLLQGPDASAAPLGALHCAALPTCEGPTVRAGDAEALASLTFVSEQVVPAGGDASEATAGEAPAATGYGYTPPEQRVVLVYRVTVDATKLPPEAESLVFQLEPAGSLFGRVRSEPQPLREPASA